MAGSSLYYYEQDICYDCGYKEEYGIIINSDAV